MSEVMHKILVVDDNDGLRMFVTQLLTRHGFVVASAKSGLEMDMVLEREPVDLVLLDSIMPIEDGLSIIKRLRAIDGPPVIMLSAKSEDSDRITGLDLGADDYMVKPFNPDELIARIRAVLRRKDTVKAKPSQIADTVFFGWNLDNLKRRLTSPEGRSQPLSNAEFSLLRVFLDHPGVSLSRDQILTHMYELHEDNVDRAIDTLISRLRRKLNQASENGEKKSDIISTIYGVGYMMRPFLQRED